MTRVALVKPDHLGDLVLASPAIRAAERYFGSVTLFVSNSTRSLARFLFPDTELRQINMPHLARHRSDFDEAATISELEEFDLVLWLRDDLPTQALASRIRSRHDFAAGSFLTHQSAIEKRMMVRHVGDYSRTELFSPEPILWPDTVKSVGLCVAAGFPTNRWPNVYWLELADLLAQSGLPLTLIGGPGERNDIALLASQLRRLSLRTAIGGESYGDFLDALNDIDLVIATDGGTAHICSVRKPVLSIFGSSPWRRYAPFGRQNVVVTRDLSCSPCLQFSTGEVNGCLTRECLIGLTPQHVIASLRSGEKASSALRGIAVHRGTSHLFAD